MAIWCGWQQKAFDDFSAARHSILGRSSEALASVFAVLCAGGAFSIAQLTESTDISRQGVTKHLQVLAQAGLVRDVKQGRERLWQLDPAQIEEAKRTLDIIGRQWEVALSKLKAFAELL